MPQVVTRLYQDHTYSRRLLGVIDRQSARFLSGGFLDEAIMEGTLVYFLGYQENYHHSLENLVYRRLLERNISAAERVGDLEASHKDLKALILQLQLVTHQVLLHANVTRDWFGDAARDCVTEIRDHMRREEDEFFPAAVKFLKPEDWLEIDSKCTAPADPLFGGEIEERYKALRADIVSWDVELV